MMISTRMWLQASWSRSWLSFKAWRKMTGVHSLTYWQNVPKTSKIWIEGWSRMICPVLWECTEPFQPGWAADRLDP